MVIQKVVIGLALIYVLTFLGGFLQATPFNFINYVFFGFLFIGGMVLINLTIKSEATGTTAAVLVLTATSTAALFFGFVAYEWVRLAGLRDWENSIEAFLYLTTLIFWILIVASFFAIRSLEASDST